MKFIISIILLVFLIVLIAQAQVNVRGYHRKDGTYVQPHIRSNPNSSKWDNYGSSRSAGKNNSGGYTSPSLRDSDNDGISNMHDTDDDNDGIHDDYDD